MPDSQARSLPRVSPLLRINPGDGLALTDYEEDDWTPALTPASGSEAYLARTGRYIKVGKQVTCWFDITLNGTGTMSGTVKLTGLPFTVAAGMYRAGAISYFGSLTTAQEPSAHAVPATTTADLLVATYSGSARSGVALDSSHIANVVNQVIGFVSYEVA